MWESTTHKKRVFWHILERVILIIQKIYDFIIVFVVADYLQVHLHKLKHDSS